ncbi:MAG: UDP-N-acetylmuramate dehydrogenase [Patescibacteria group bacterium]
MLIEEKIIKNKILAPLTSFKIGGSAKFFIEIKNSEELKKAVCWAKERKEKIVVFSGGSNILINNSGIDGLVIKLSDASLLIDNNEIICGAGVRLAQVVNITIDNKLTGLEWATGIPGTVGGGVYGNAGAFGSAMATTVKDVVAYDIENNAFSTFDNKQCCFGYRDSIFKQTDNLIIVKVRFVLTFGRQDEIKKLVDNYLIHRNNAQPKDFSAGSIFKNLSFDYLQLVNSDLANQAEEAGIVKGGKVATSWVIDKLGLKNKQIGFAKVSEKHAGFILNVGKAKAKDVVDLINFIKQQAKEKYNIELNEEIRYLGF